MDPSLSAKVLGPGLSADGNLRRPVATAAEQASRATPQTHSTLTAGRGEHCCAPWNPAAGSAAEMLRRPRTFRRSGALLAQACAARSAVVADNQAAHVTAARKPSRCAIRLIRHAARHSHGPSRKRCEPSNPEICLQRNAAEGSRGRWRSPVRGPRSRPPRLCSPPAAHGEAGLHSRPRQYLNPGERVTPRSCNQ